MKDILYIVIPCYNEAEVIETTVYEDLEKLNSLIRKELISKKSKILFINDGSKDETWNKLLELSKNNPKLSSIKLSRNFGHQNALLAGLNIASRYADMTISMDADLQDDLNTIDKMIEKYYDGNEIVYGVRNNRKKDSFFKRNTAKLFYKLMKFMGADIIENHADYRLMSKNVINHLKDFSETNLFLRGIIPLIGFKSCNVYYERKKRLAGETKYPLKKMIAFAVDGITSFSIKPLKMVTSIGLLIFIISIFAMLYILYAKFFLYTEVGWSSLICSMWLLGGIQLLCLGIVGEYIGKIYSEVKNRPKFIIEEKINIE